jgi:protein-L-isoaspartate(D-aspartate) O-methyltransferase
MQMSPEFATYFARIAMMVSRTRPLAISSSVMTSKPLKEAELAIVRRAYARQMLAIAGVADDVRLEDAFAAVRREDFLGPPPWLFSGAFGYETLPSDDPVLLYQDILIALAPERGVNNGSPSLHARWLGALAPKQGARLAHLGAGSGYYTAIMAKLVGASGHVDAVEIDPDLAGMARRALAPQSNVAVITADALTGAKRGYDGVYVNFAVEQPVKAWTDSLAMGGRLIFPLGVAQPSHGKKNIRHSSHGAGFMIERRKGGLAARWLGRAWFVCAEAEAAVSDAARDALRAAFERGGAEFVNSLHWDNAGPPGRDWATGDGWRLSYDSVDT